MKTIPFQSMRLLVFGVAVGCLALVHTANAQYFGQNKVQYEDFDFKILKTEHFDIYYYEEEATAAKQVGRLAERWLLRHQKLLADTLTGRQPFILYASHPHFQQTNAISGGIGEGTGGVTEAFKRRVILPFAGTFWDTDHVIGHEIVHAFQYDITGQGRSVQNIGALRLPLWLIEGMAEYLSVGPEDAHTAMWIRDAMKHEKLPTMQQLFDPRFFPYRYGQAFLAYLGGTYGDETIGQLLKAGGQVKDVYLALKSVYGVGADTLNQQWHEAVKRAYEPLLKTTSDAEQYGRLLIGKKTGSGELNIAPALSPDGKHVIFFSEKDLFAINLFLADAETGKIRRSIVKAERDPHLESLQFINSAGAWNHAGTQIVFASIEKGRPVLNLLDIQGDKVVKKIRFPELGEILNPAWSPDGRYLAFSALAGGYSDLFIYDMQTEKLARVTNDLFTDIQPAWSPDGRRLAFVTDRFTGNMETLAPGNVEIALYEPATGTLSRVDAFDRGKHINPQWSPDGNSIYFLSDYTGITNLYRVELSSGNLYQITNLFTGASGITWVSPALSAAAATNSVVFCAYEDGKYNIYRIDDPAVLAGQPVQDEPLGGIPRVSMLPPQQRKSSVWTLLNHPENGLPAPQEYPVKPYRPKFSLDYVGQPYLGGGINSYGVQLGGGASLYWSDMLGNRSLITGLQIQSSSQFTDISGVLAYTNLNHRWDWGAALQQIPFAYDQVAAGFGVIDSTQAFIEQRLRQRQIERSLALFSQYPFNRAMRLEVSATLTNIGFSSKLQTRAFDVQTGREILDRTEDLPAPDDLFLAGGSVALVYDNSVYGVAGPLVGTRYRLEVTPSFGSLDYYTILTDLRRYFLPVRPFTLAFRALHYGRYGGGAEDSRFLPLFIGYQSLVRGYDSRSFNADECSGADCPEFDRLLGSRIAVANAEVRFPLLGLLGLGPGYYGALPLETGMFYDAGVAWTKQEEASFLGGNRDFVTSYGFMLRFNLFGFAVMELDYVKPLDRPNKNWRWQFNFTPGL